MGGVTLDKQAVAELTAPTLKHTPKDTSSETMKESVEEEDKEDKTGVS